MQVRSQQPSCAQAAEVQVQVWTGCSTQLAQLMFPSAVASHAYTRQKLACSQCYCCVVLSCSVQVLAGAAGAGLG
jgi:hypothetical protein